MGLRILLTGEPKVGKSTIIRRSLGSVSDAFGFLTTELRQDDQRYGFIVEDDRGRTVVLSSIHLLTDTQVGRYHVDVLSFDRFLKDLGTPVSDQLLYIDEIGRMQTLSSTFREILDDLMNLSNMMIGTVAKDDYDPLIKYIKNDAETVLIDVSVDNRDDVLKLIQSFVVSPDLIGSLNTVQYNRFVSIARETSDLMLLYKLFHNTLSYVTGNKIIQRSDSIFEVLGFTSRHYLHLEKDRFVCDCLVYSQKQLCSHVFAVQLLTQK